MRIFGLCLSYQFFVFKEAQMSYDDPPEPLDPWTTSG